MTYDKSGKIKKQKRVSQAHYALNSLVSKMTKFLPNKTLVLLKQQDGYNSHQDNKSNQMHS